MKLKRAECIKCKYHIIVDSNFLGLVPLTDCKLIEEDDKTLILELRKDRLYCNKVEER